MDENIETLATTPRRLKLARSWRIFAALGDETRLRIVARLCEGGPLSITRLTEGTSISRQAVTKHLQALENAEVVRSRRAGRERLWELRTKRLARARRDLRRISKQWNDALGRLRNLVEPER